MTVLTFEEKTKIVGEMIGIPWKYLQAVGVKLKYDGSQAQVDGLRGEELHFRLAEKPVKR